MMRARTRSAAAPLLLLLQLLWAFKAQASPISRPLADDAKIGDVLADELYNRDEKQQPSREYHSNRPLKFDAADLVVSKYCGMTFEPLWSTQVGSPVYATPLIYPVHGDGTKEVLLATFARYIELVEHDGFKPPGWPVSFEGSTFHASPLIYDIDHDGNADICVTSGKGDIFWLRLGEYGKYLEDFHIQVPRLHVQKGWYEGLTEEAQQAYMHASMFESENRVFDEIKSLKDSAGKRAQAGDSLSVRTGLDAKRKTGRRLLAEEEQEGDAAMEGAAGDPDAGLEGMDAPPENDFSYFGDYRYDYGFLDDVFGYAHPYYDFDTKKVAIDAHVLATPAVADADNDGNIELIVPISYYFDPATYGARALEDGIDPSMYVAGGIGSWDFEIEDWSWLIHLDMTTTKTKYQAFIYASPVVVDLEGDGAVEVIVGTALGLLYVLDGRSGLTRRNFPMQFGPIHASVAVADVAGDSDLEMIVGDMNGNLVVIGPSGEIIWDKQLSGGVHHAPSIGDIDGDGDLDIVVSAVSSTGENHIWAFNAADGQVLPLFPVKTPKAGTLVSSILLTRISFGRGLFNVVAPKKEEDPDGTGASGDTPSKRRNGLQLVVPSFDGHVYVIDGASGCTSRIDVGEHIASAPLVEDIDGDGSFDLLLGTMNGQVIALDTHARYDPLYAWASRPRHRHNGFTVGQQGVHFAEDDGSFSGIREVRGGPHIPVTFVIVDNRQHSDDSEPKYHVTISRSVSSKNTLFDQTFTKPGTYTVELFLPRPGGYNLVLGMTNEHAQYFEDTATFSVNERFYQYIKYIIFAAVLALAAPLLFMAEVVELPSFL